LAEDYKYFVINMKKLLGIFVLGLLWCNVGFAGPILKLPNDVVSGNKFFKSMNSEGKFKDYGFKIVDKSDDSPVRAGSKSLRFEIRAGDCYVVKTWNDCETRRERHELHGKKLFNKGEWWHAWSIYFPKNFIEVSPVRVFMGQFHSKDKKYGDEHNPPWMFFNTSMENIGGYWINNKVRVPAGYSTQLLTKEEAYGKWNDILINVKWTDKDDGFMKIWVNEKIKLDYNGPTKRRGAVYFKFGIYRVRIFDKKTPTQVVYYDEVRVGKKKEDVVGNLPPLQ